ncbi:hypothetical protein K8S19_06480 [bacterium]|nr:hypothetical protein [bacterium]
MSDLSPKEIINIVKETLIEQDFMVGIFIYGSFLKSEATVQTEMELFILVAGTNSIDACTETVRAIEKMLKVKISPIIWSVDELDKPDNAIVQLVFRDGKMVYWNSLHDFSASQVFKIKPHTIFTFSLKNLPQNKKAQFNYRLYGKKAKQGILEEAGGVRLSKSCFHVPYGSKFKISRFFSKLSIQFDNKECWI